MIELSWQCDLCKQVRTVGVNQVSRVVSVYIPGGWRVATVEHGEHQVCCPDCQHSPDSPPPD